MVEDRNGTPEIWKSATLVLLGHGSTGNAGGNKPTIRQAAEIRRRSLFAEVREGFILGDPSITDVVAEIKTPVIYIVPNMVSKGYVTDEVIPRKLELTGPVTERIGPNGRQSIYLCEPVGTHPSIAETLIGSLRSLINGAALPPKDTALLIIGHGSNKNPGNARQTQALADTLAKAHIAGESKSAFIEIAPKADQWPDLVSASNVIAVPFLIGGGRHEADDIPEMLGLDAEDEKIKGLTNGENATGPFQVGGRQLWLCRTVGADPVMTEIILNRVATAGSITTTTDSG